ncbi:hypothetical protein FDG2_4270 [Candidatus Protofrankia californiensis]|uniref:Uncharacterized protein n=1 Tax=Candidatus Protofrankia californiensis TaxID=1839754 RepID=A0A1C3P4T0_9ACTN|nr:hypothetical protein FDG2_4270 [Candidatus Protofrankia californiensis]
MSLLEGDGPADVRYRWLPELQLPELQLPDADGLLVCEQSTWDQDAGRSRMEEDFLPVRPGDLIEAAFCAATQLRVMMVTVHRPGSDLMPSWLAMVVGLRLGAHANPRGLVMCGSPLDGLDATFQGRWPVVHEVLVWDSGDVWVARGVWEIMAPERYQAWISRRQIIGLGGSA